ncbi:hypothetical protein HYH03_005021 [Edaphochlamys debaryana]|uniref:SRCR domain-containing protein n=1 Tax=Edaphochlamys debaryana TaxID=47281 RepID=A0A835Y926_9CHLO|nr:hypothetical protein HYH03_005021 [Edaphochlamys debaryana]|eukprot:KAG2497018.1 hypothetical protein HYH03_005021 [Edaphochlamys debaryana]
MGQPVVLRVDRRPQWRQTVLACLVFALLLSAQAEAKKKKPVRNKNGIRLVKGKGSKGRLEISSKDQWLVTPGDAKGTAWRPMCDVGSYSDELAQTMCELLGYKYGRKYYTAAVNSRPYNAAVAADWRTHPVDYMYCGDVDDTAGHRRLLRDVPRRQHTGAERLGAEGRAGSGAASSNAMLRGRTGRDLQSVFFGEVNIPAAAKVSCEFRMGSCNFTGPLAGLECANKPFKPLPSPSPSPSPSESQPPPPPPKQASIRLRGDFAGALDALEPNLCDLGDCSFGRAEIQVEDPSKPGELVWAPLCAPLNMSSADWLVDIACKQATGYPDSMPGTIWHVNGEPGEPFPVPTGNVTTPGDFDPAAYPVWASVVGEETDAEPQRIQDLTLALNASCPGEALLSLRCSILMARR